VLTDSATVTWDRTVAGQIKANAAGTAPNEVAIAATDPGAGVEIWVDTSTTAFAGGPWVQLTQAAYDALSPPDANTLYVVVG
jgi:hypothetical protein